MKSLHLTFFLLLSALILNSCKNEPKTTSAEVTNTPAAKAKTDGDISTLELLDHDIDITPEGSKLFLEGFFKNSLVKGAITINNGSLHIKDGLITKGAFNLDMNSIEMVANVDESMITFLKSKDVFDNQRFTNGSFIIEECTKAINDQQATHLIKGTLELMGKSIPFNTKARIDYRPKFITILTPGIKIKASELGIKMADPSQDNLYFSLTLNGQVL